MGCPVEVDGHHFDVPAHMLGLIPATSWGEGIEQQERGFQRQVVEAFGSTARIDEILSFAAMRHCGLDDADR